MPEPPPQLPEDGPTKLVEGSDGELVERLSGGTATLLLVWLVGIGAGSALLAAWLLAALLLRVRLGPEHLFGAPGLYGSLYGASGPTILWLTGRAQGHSLGWFMLTAAKIGLVMAAVVIGGRWGVTGATAISSRGSYCILLKGDLPCQQPRQYGTKRHPDTSPTP